MALLGASGCGKSLMLKCIAGIEKPDKGLITINGETVFDSAKQINIPPQKRNVGYLFQNYALFPNMTLWNNISCVVKRPKTEKTQIIENIIKSFQLEGVKDLYPGQVSGGQQQRAALARILVSNPKILMLDEPFSALDSHLKWDMEQEIMSVLAKFGGTTIFVSHDRDEAYRVSDKIAVMNNGNIEITDNKENIFDAPKTLAAAKITGCRNISKAEKGGDSLVKATDWGIVLKTASIVPDNIKYVGIRAHHFEMANDENNDNTYLCHIHQVIDEPFEKVIIFSFEKGNGDVKLHFKLPKSKWNDYLPKDFIICLPNDKIMHLE